MNYPLDICLLKPEEQQRRIDGLRLDSPALITDNANLFYLTGRVFCGYLFLEPGNAPRYFVKRPSELRGDGITLIRKPEEIGLTCPCLGLELDSLSYSAVMRLKTALNADDIVNVSPKIMLGRAVKTPHEQQLLREDGLRHAAVYSRIPALFREGMTDIELQAEIERVDRLEGCLGQFRVNGPDMEIHMGNVITGRNADTPSPYDFAMGGAGLSPSLPVGASGEEIKPGQAVMIDMNGNFNGYMTDMTRTFACGRLPEKALRAHQCSIDICHALAALAKPGVECKVLYEKAKEIAGDAGLEDCFMGHKYHAGFVGHGVGIQINELPVLAPRSKSVMEEGNVIAIEPKFVIEGVGAVGIENTYICRPDGLECITPAPEGLTQLL
ncbi:MAG: Xaa-Pro peptidase family protein [Muribaculaceae bacterium]|nr:Xaa-Pro peptidase family protein [Muribaculaceae bacterium]